MICYVLAGRLASGHAQLELEHEERILCNWKECLKGDGGCCAEYVRRVLREARSCYMERIGIEGKFVMIRKNILRFQLNMVKNETIGNKKKKLKVGTRLRELEAKHKKYIYLEWFSDQTQGSQLFQTFSQHFPVAFGAQLKMI